LGTQEERVTTLEQTFAIFRKETAARTQEIEENTTIMLGVMRSQGRDIRRIFESLETLHQRVETLHQRADALNQGVEILHQKVDRLETKSDEQTTLLTQILARLPNNL
jgi:predicted RNase H-like nuclease (RuvC/YqgF family)